MARAKGCCEYCRSQERYATQVFSVEHIVPRQSGGRMALENLALACQGCNNHKYTKTTAPDPVSTAVVPLFHPRHQHWHDHFAWDDTYMVVIGLTPIGRATVEALRLNRPGPTNLRRVARGRRGCGSHRGRPSCSPPCPRRHSAKDYPDLGMVEKALPGGGTEPSPPLAAFDPPALQGTRGTLPTGDIRRRRPPHGPP